MIGDLGPVAEGGGVSRAAPVSSSLLSGDSNRRWRDGTTHVVFEPDELVEKLAALVPPPRFHLVRYHGILGPCASERGRVVRGTGTAHGPVRLPPGKTSIDLPGELPSKTARQGLERDSIPDRCSPSGEEGNRASPASAGPEESQPRSDEPTLRPRRLAWAELLRRVFAVDVLEYPRCGGPMRLLATTATVRMRRRLRRRRPPARRHPRDPRLPAAPAVPDREEWAGDFDATL
jgi:hypothetical protein